MKAEALSPRWYRQSTGAVPYQVVSKLFEGPIFIPDVCMCRMGGRVCSFPSGESTSYPQLRGQTSLEPDSNPF